MSETIGAVATEVSAIDRAIAAGLWIGNIGADWLAGDAAEEAGQSKILLQERIGQNGEPFIIYKWRTEDGESGIALSDHCKLMRRFTLDEWTQEKYTQRHHGLLRLATANSIRVH